MPLKGRENVKSGENGDGARDLRRIAIGYLRSSTTRQAESGIGLEAQAVAIEAYADENGYLLRRVFSEAASARGKNNLDQRPQLWAAINAAKRDEADLLVCDFGRLTREASDLNRITQELPAHRIISTNEGMSLAQPQAAGRIRYHQKQGEKISERTKAGMQRKKADTGVGYGNPDIRTIQVSGMEAFSAIADSIREALADLLEELGDDAKRLGNKEFAQLANDRGLRTARGNLFDGRKITDPRKDAEEILRQRKAKPSDDPPPSPTENDPPVNRNPNWGRF